MPSTFQYWRVLFNGPTNGNSVVAIAEMSFRDANNNPISLSSGTSSASSFFNGSFVVANAFDGDPNTAWASSANPSLGVPQWLQYQLASAQAVACVVLIVRNDSGWASQSPVAFLVQSSPDGTTWTTRNTVTGFTWGAAGQTAFFAASTVVGHALASQIAVETALLQSPHALASQIAVETLINPSAHVKASQVATEYLINAMPHVKASQICVELIYPFIPNPGAVPIQNFLLP